MEKNILTNMSRSSLAQKDEMNDNHVNNAFLTMKNGHLNSQRNYYYQFHHRNYHKHKHTQPITYEQRTTHILVDYFNYHSQFYSGLTPF